jgi:BMFP domain-containing protein YqiC
VDELRVVQAAVREEAAQAREAEAKAREDASKAREAAAKAREDLVPLLARVKELEEDVALVSAMPSTSRSGWPLLASKPWRTRLRR